MKSLIVFISFLGITYSTFAQDKDKGELLYEAVFNDDVNKVKKLIAKGADVNYVKQVGPWMKISVLIAAVNNGNYAIVTMLLDNKANIYWRDGDNYTAIMHAASRGSLTLLTLLMSYGADIHDHDGKGNTVLTLARKSKDPDLIKFVEIKLEK